jgi:DNA transposition AAA+ family ATPase
MIAQGTDADKVTEEQITGVAADVQLFINQHKIYSKDVARSLGYSPGVVSEFLKGTYAGNKAKVAIDLDEWLVEEEQRRSRPATTQFVWTQVAMQIKATASYALDKKTIALVYGPDTSGIGKTTALQAIHQEMGPRRSTLVTIDKVDANPTGLLTKICDAMRKDHTGSNRQKFARIVEHLTGRSHLLLIDQIHSLRGSKDDKPFYILADLFDATKTAQLWCGTADLDAYLQRRQKSNADESLAQIRRRIFPRVDLMEALRAEGGGGGAMLVTVDQVREMFAKNKMKLVGHAARFLCELANQPDTGGIGICVQLVEFATVLAEHNRLPSIDLELIKKAMRIGFMNHKADLLLHRIEQSSPPARAARAG